MLIKEEWTKLAISLTHALHVYIFKEIQTQGGRGGVTKFQLSNGIQKTHIMI